MLLGPEIVLKPSCIFFFYLKVPSNTDTTRIKSVECKINLWPKICGSFYYLEYFMWSVFGRKYLVAIIVAFAFLFHHLYSQTRFKLMKNTSSRIFYCWSMPFWFDMFLCRILYARKVNAFTATPPHSCPQRSVHERII